jgi:hypothetical protein
MRSSSRRRRRSSNRRGRINTTRQVLVLNEARGYNSGVIIGGYMVYRGK